MISRDLLKDFRSSFGLKIKLGTLTAVLLISAWPSQSAALDVADLSKSQKALHDALTVSGRYELPKAGADLQSKIIVSQRSEARNELQDFVAKTVKTRSDVFTDVMQMAFSKSLANYGYVSRSDAINPIPIEYEITQADFEEREDGLLASVVMDISSDHSCLNAQSSSKYLALSIKDKQKGRKAFAVVIGMAAALGNGLYFMDQQLATARNLNKRGVRDVVGVPSGVGHSFQKNQFDTIDTLSRIKTYGEDLAVGEGYAPKRGERTAKTYALKNAIRLSMAKYITLIDEQCR